MKKFSCFKSVLMSLCFILTFALNTSALNYTITFTGSGASTTVESVIVQNLTKGTTVTVPAGNVLNLSDTPNSIEELHSDVESISISPNPIQSNAIVLFFSKQNGIALISAYSLKGQMIANLNTNLPQGYNSFKLTLPKGIYLIQIKGNGYSYNTKAISEAASNVQPQITFNPVKTNSKLQKSKSAITTMLYAYGDQLLYKGKYGNYTTIVTDKPNSTKTTNFQFIECKDGDGNYYPIVKIGTQFWMAENLRTTKFNDGTSIKNITIDQNWINGLYTPLWCFYSYNSTIGKVYGNLYDMYAGCNDRIAPTGWHVPNNNEWSTLSDFLGGSLVAGGKLKETGFTHWNSPNIEATNSSGFSALPGGYKAFAGGFLAMKNSGYWWSATYLNGYNYHIQIYSDYAIFGLGIYKEHSGYSVRCVQN